jgi:hypothetical protein
LKPRVSILCHTLAGNALGRAWVFHELLREEFEVELVVSARRGDNIWKPLAQSGLAPRRWFVHSWPGFHWRARSIARELVTGDLIIAIKPRLHSYGLGLAARRERPRPLLLDVDDWELGFWLGRILEQRPSAGCRRPATCTRAGIFGARGSPTRSR